MKPQEPADPDFPNNDIEKLIEAHKALLSELYRVRNSIPIEGASQEEIDKWANLIVDRQLHYNKDTGMDSVGLSAPLSGQSWTEWVNSIVNESLDPITKRINAVEGVAHNALEDVKSELTNTINDVRGRLRSMEDLFDNIEKRIKEKVWEVASYPVTLAEGKIEGHLQQIIAPIAEKLEGALSLFKTAHELEKNGILEAKKRLTWVGKAFAFLFKNEELNDVAKLFSDLIDHKNPTTNLEDLVRHMVLKINPMFGAIYWVVESVKNGKLQVPDDLGFGLSPGRLYGFVNDEDLEPGERDFRIELISSIDRYFHGEHGPLKNPFQRTIPRTTQMMDGKTSIQTLNDILGVLLRTSFGFVFRAPNMPSIIAPKMSLLRTEQKLDQSLVAAKHASATISRALSAPIKAISGLLLRGFWEVSSHNNALVELVSSFISQTIGSIVESFTHSLYGLVEIREVYEDPSKNDRCLLSWQTQAVWGNENRTYQAVIVRKGFLGDEELEKKLDAALKKVFDEEINDGSMIRSLLKDYGTYLELSRDFHEPDMTDESIKVTATKKDHSIGVKAEFKDPDNDLPVVLRVYAEGAFAIMDSQYRAELNCNFESVRKVHVFAGTSAHGSWSRNKVVA